MRLLDPFGWIARTWDFLEARDPALNLLDVPVMGAVILGHVVGVALIIAFVAYLASSFTGGFRDGLQRGRSK